MPRGKTGSSVGDLVKMKELRREDVEALFDGKTTLPLPGGYALVLPDLAKLTPYSREAIMTALLQADAVRE